jgi:hypothetical protein
MLQVCSYGRLVCDLLTTLTMDAGDVQLAVKTLLFNVIADVSQSLVYGM